MSNKPELIVVVPIYYKRTNDKRAEFLVDLKDWNNIKDINWRLMNGYVYYKNIKTIYVHNLIMGEPTSPDLEVDHINRNRLDNRRSNLRWVTRGKNLANRKVWSNTGHRGITYLDDYNRSKPYRVQIKFNHNHISQNFATLEEAIEVRKQLELDLYGCNFE